MMSSFLVPHTISSQTAQYHLFNRLDVRQTGIGIRLLHFAVMRCVLDINLGNDFEFADKTDIDCLLLLHKTYGLGNVRKSHMALASLLSKPLLWGYTNIQSQWYTDIFIYAMEIWLSVIGYDLVYSDYIQGTDTLTSYVFEIMTRGSFTYLDYIYHKVCVNRQQSPLALRDQITKFVHTERVIRVNIYRDYDQITINVGRKLRWYRHRLVHERMPTVHREHRLNQASEARDRHKKLKIYKKQSKSAKQSAQIAQIRRQLKNIRKWHKARSLKAFSRKR